MNYFLELRQIQNKPFFIQCLQVIYLLSIGTSKSVKKLESKRIAVLSWFENVSKWLWIPLSFL